MKKNTINAFTLVEMLIVIVIIGILIAALMPRMQAAQGRARDVSRKTALSQMQSAIVTSQGDNGIWPGQGEDAGTCEDCAQNGIGVTAVSGALLRAGMNSIPVDPLKTNVLPGLAGFTGTDAGDYGYMVTTRNGSENGGFILMAKTEVEGGSNWIVCTEDGITIPSGKDNLSGGFIGRGADIVDIHPCTEFEKDETNTIANCKIEGSKCIYTSDDQLRYILLY